MGYQINQVEKLILTDIEEKGLHDKIEKRNLNSDMESKITYKQADAQKIPMENASVDTVVATLIFCSVPDVEAGLNEIKRILKPGGQLIFIEHVISYRRSLASVMNFVTPLWKKLAHGCHLNRDYHRSLQSCGFNIDESHKRLGAIFIGGIAQPI